MVLPRYIMLLKSVDVLTLEAKLIIKYLFDFQEGQADVILLLLQFGADPNTIDNQGRTGTRICVCVSSSRPVYPYYNNYMFCILALDIARKARKGDRAVEILVQHQRK